MIQSATITASPARSSVGRPARSLAEHFAISPITRGQRSVVAALAYAAGTGLHDERTGLTHDYRRKRDVAAVELVGRRGDLRSYGEALEAAETRRNARTARSYIIALPHELPLDAQRQLVRGYCEWLH